MQDHIGRIDLADIRVTGVMRELTAYRTWSVGIGAGNADRLLGELLHAQPAPHGSVRRLEYAGVEVVLTADADADGDATVLTAAFGAPVGGFLTLRLRTVGEGARHVEQFVAWHDPRQDGTLAWSDAEQAALAVALRRAYAEDVLVLDDRRVRLARQARADFRAWVRELGGVQASALLDAAVRHVEYHWRPDGMRAACAPEARTWRRGGPDRFEILVRHDALRRGPALTVVVERTPDGWRVTSIAGHWPTVKWHAIAAAR